MTAVTASESSRRFRNLVAAIATVFVADVAFGLTYPLLNLVLEDQKVDTLLIGLNSAMAPLGIICASIFLPGLAARFGSKILAYCAIVAISISMLLLPLFRDVWSWFAIRFIIGVAGGTLYSLSEAWVMHFTDNTSRGRVTAIYTGVMALGFCIGPFVIPYTGIHGWLPFLIGFAVMAVSAWPLLFVAIGKDEFATKESANMAGFAKRAPMLLVAVGAVTFFDAVIMSFFPIYALRSGLDLKTASWALGVAIIGNVLLQYPAGWLADRWSRKGVIALAAAITALLALSLPFVVNSWLLWPVVLLIGSSAFAVYTISLTILGDNFKGQMLIAGSAAIAAMWGFGGIGGPPLAGAALDAIGPDGLPMVLFGVFALLLVSMVLARGRMVRN